MKVGLLGGTFNPIHTGHLVLAQECWLRLALDKVIFIPAHVPPHKTVEQDVSVGDRLNMVRSCVEADERFELSGYEIDKKGTSYSIDTIRYFKGRYGQGTEIFFLTGADSAEGLLSWKDIDRILELTTFVIASRPGWEADTGVLNGRVTRIAIPLIDISSTFIRERLRNNEPIDYLVPFSVSKYIKKKGLYRAGA